MRQQPKQWIHLLTCLLTLALTSCNESDCGILGRPEVKYNFVSSLNPDKAVALDSLTVVALNTIQGDSILQNRLSKVSKILLPLSYSQTETTFVLRYTKRLRDTIWIEHSNRPFFISMDCGTAVFSHINKIRYTTYGLDSAAIQNPEIDNNEKENIKIYFTPATN